MRIIPAPANSRVLVRIILCLFLVSQSFGACRGQDTVTIKAPWRTSSTNVLPRTEKITGGLIGCIPAAHIEYLLEDPRSRGEVLLGFLGIHSQSDEVLKDLVDNMKEVLRRSGMDCAENGILAATSFDQHVGVRTRLGQNVLDRFNERIQLDHRDHLTIASTEKELSEVQRDARDQLAFYVNSTHTNNGPEPGAVALSVRPITKPEQRESIFLALKGEAQAEIIRFAASQNSKTALGEHLRQLTSLFPRKEESFSGVEEVELTISDVVNSASAEDGFSYVTAYLALSPFGDTVDTNSDVAWQWLRGFSRLQSARSVKDREDHKISDLERSLYDLRASFEAVDTLKTEVVQLDRGTVKSIVSREVQVGPQFQGFGTGSLTAKSSTESENKFQQQLDKRSAWLNDDRTLLRITQRGTPDATIAGSISSAITIRLPRLSVQLVELDASNYRVRFRPAQYPLYKSVNALGVVIGVIQISKRPGKPTLYYTVISDLLPFRLVQNSDRAYWVETPLGLLSPEAYVSSPELATYPLSIINVALRFSAQFSRSRDNDLMLFKDYDSLMQFKRALEEGHIKLQKHKTEKVYVLRMCGADEPLRDEPTPEEPWIGLASYHGVAIPFYGEAFTTLPDIIGTCNKQ